MASGDVIDAERRTISMICGTHQGNFMGMPPTGKRVVAMSIGIRGFVEGAYLELERSYFSTR